jgi:hypothetical protein
VKEPRWYVISRFAAWLCIVLTFAAGFMVGAAVAVWVATS